MRRVIAYISQALAMFFGGCVSTPQGLKPVTNFQVARYIGIWYEVARLDHSFEHGLSKVTAEYSKRSDGRITVINRGFDAKRGKWREARGVAQFLGRPEIASLKVSFFWPFWGGYHVIALDRDNYNYAMVTSSNRSYLWILARQIHLEPTVRDDLLAKAKSWGFRTEDLIFVEQ